MAEYKVSDLWWAFTHINDASCVRGLDGIKLPDGNLIPYAVLVGWITSTYTHPIANRNSEEEKP